MYTDRQQPVTQPSSDSQDPVRHKPHDTTDFGSPYSFGGAGGSGRQTRTDANNTAQSVHTILTKFDQWREVLRKPNVRKRLLSDLDPSEILHSFHYIPVADEQQIETRQRNNGRTAGVEIFLDVLGRLGEPSWPDDFCRVLQENGQPYLSDLLRQEHRLVESNVGNQSAFQRFRTDFNSMRNIRSYKPSIPPAELEAMLQYCDLWKATVRREKRLLRDNVDPTNISMYFPYMSNKVDEKVQATLNTQGRMRAMDVFIDDGLMYVGDQNWPNDLCFALKQINQGYIAEGLKRRFMEFLSKGQDTKYRQLNRHLRSPSSNWAKDFGEAHSTGVR